MRAISEDFATAMTEKRAGPEASRVADPVLVELLRLLAKVPALVERAESCAVGLSRAGSLEAADRASPVGMHVGALARLKLAIAGDHLMAMFLICHGEATLPIWAHFSLLRTAAECAIDVLWLLDPDQSSETRVARGVGRLLDALEQRALGEAEVPSLMAPGQSMAQRRVEELLAEAEVAAVTPALFPGTTQLAKTIKAMGLGQDAYTIRYLDGIAEGVPWAAVLGDQRDVVNEDRSGGIVRIRTSADPLMTWYATLATIRQFQAAIESLESYTRRPLAPARPADSELPSSR